MLLPDTEAAELRKWIITKLEKLDAVADTDVLADFVIALLRTETEESQLKQDAYSELKDFLQSHTQTFIDEVFTTVSNKSYLPDYVPPKTTPSPLPKPTRSGAIDLAAAPQNDLGSKKRKHTEMQGNERRTNPANRPIKQPRNVRGRGADRGRGGRAAYVDLDQPAGQNFPEMPMPMPDFPLNQYPDPFAAMAALQAMGFPSMPMPQMQNPSKKKGRCHAYDNKGFCARGDACPYQHGDDYYSVPGADDYDPKNPSPVSPTNGQGQNGFRRGRAGRQHGRASISHTGPLNDRSATTVVVEQIPEEKFNEEEVRAYFTEFGAIAEVQMQPYKRIAVVKYDDHDSAQAAYGNPKAVFDNRFVKVYWHRPDRSGMKESQQAEEDTGEATFDQEEFERKSREAQRRLEAKKAQLKEMTSQREALQKQKIELAQKQLEEKRRLQEKLAGKTPSSAQSPERPGTSQVDGESVSDTTKALRAKLAELEAEAASLGIDHSAPEETYSPRGRGRGRGRGSYRGWEAFGPSYRGRGSYRGGRGSWGGGGKYNLDLRTKKVSVAGVEWNSERDEALRQYLLGIGDYDKIETHPDQTDTLIVSFKDRPTAESFFYGTKELPGIGKGNFSWFSAPMGSNGVGKTNPDSEGLDRDGDVGMAEAGLGDIGGANHEQSGDVDYDVAEEDDRWN